MLFMTKKRTPALSSTPEYKTWVWMKSRCQNMKAGNYKYYGGRGITVCARWSVFDNFLHDMGKKPEGMSLDRIDNDGNYHPDNCRWATQQEQTRNTRMSKFLTYKGETKNISQWSQETGISTYCINTRLLKGLSLDEVFLPTNNSPSKLKEEDNMTAEAKKTNKNIKIDKKLTKRFEGVALFKECSFETLLEKSMQETVDKFDKERKA